MLPTSNQARAPRAFRSVDAGDVDDRAEKLITGGNSLLFNRWRRVAVFGAGTAFPAGIEVTNRGLGIDLVPTSIGLTWDDAQALELPEQSLAAGETKALRIDARRGNVLEVWADDADVSAQLVRASELERRAAEREQKDQANDPVAGFFGALSSFVQGQAVVGVVVLAIAGVVLWQVAKNWNGALPASGLKFPT